MVVANDHHLNLRAADYCVVTALVVAAAFVLPNPLVSLAAIAEAVELRPPVMVKIASWKRPDAGALATA